MYGASYDYNIWGPDSPIDYGRNRLTPVTAEQLQTFVGALKEKLIANGATIISGKSGVVGTSAGDGERREIGDFHLLAPATVAVLGAALSV